MDTNGWSAICLYSTGQSILKEVPVKSEIQALVVFIVRQTHVIILRELTRRVHSMTACRLYLHVNVCVSLFNLRYIRAQNLILTPFII